MINNKRKLKYNFKFDFDIESERGIVQFMVI